MPPPVLRFAQESMLRCIVQQTYITPSKQGGRDRRYGWPACVGIRRVSNESGSAIRLSNAKSIFVDWGRIIIAESNNLPDHIIKEAEVHLEKLR